MKLTSGEAPEPGLLLRLRLSTFCFDPHLSIAFYAQLSTIAMRIVEEPADRLAHRVLRWSYWSPQSRP